MGRFWLGVDIGGTFTDVVLLGGDESLRRRKLLSTPPDYARGVIDGVGRAARRGRRAARTRSTGIVHATTVASNAVLEGQGRPHGADHDRGLPRRAGDAAAAHPGPLRPPVREARAARPPAPPLRGAGADRPARRGVARARRARRRTRSPPPSRTARAEAVAIALLHSYANPAHEQRVAEIVRAACPPDDLRHLLVRDPARDPRVRADEHVPWSTPTSGRSSRATSSRSSRGSSGRASTRRCGIMQSSGGRHEPAGGAAAAGRACWSPARRPASSPAPTSPGWRRRARPHLARHGRDDGQGGDHRGRPARPDERVRGRRGHQPQQPAGPGRRLRGPAAVHRHLGDRRRRRQHRRRRRASASSPSGPAARARIRARSATAAAARRRRSPTRCVVLGYLNPVEPRRRRGAARRRGRARAALRASRSPSPLGPAAARRRARRLHARRGDDDAGGQGGHDLPRPRPARLRRCAASAATARSRRPRSPARSASRA